MVEDLIVDPDATVQGRDIRGWKVRGCSDSYLLSLSSLGGTFSSRFQYVLGVDVVSGIICGDIWVMNHLCMLNSPDGEPLVK